MNTEKIKKAVSNFRSIDAVKFDISNDLYLTMDDKKFRLTPWRCDRRLYTVRGLAIDDNRLREICSYKSVVIDKASKDIMRSLFIELDTLEWMLDDSIVSVYALGDLKKTISMIIRTKKDILCSIEIATTLSDETNPITRHEIVGLEGMISDRSINEQVPFQAVYAFSADKKDPMAYTDMDSLMQGCTPFEVTVAENVINIIDGLYDDEKMKENEKRINYLVECVVKSVNNEETVNVEVDNK